MAPRFPSAGGGALSLPTVLLDAASANIKPAIESMRGADGANFICRVWAGHPGSPVLIYLHGIEGHSQWFENTAAVLNGRGITVFAPDRRGAGANHRERGSLVSHKIFLADVEDMIKRIGHYHSGSPIVLMANCWSARAAAIIAREDYKPQGGPLPSLSGLILTCPAIFTKADFPRSTKLKIFFEWIQGSYRLMQYWPIPLKTEMFTDNQPYLDFIERDPLRLTEATTSFYAETFIMGWRARRAAKHVNLPTLLLQSEKDQIVDVSKVETWHTQLKTNHKVMRVFPDASHSLDFDQNWFKEYTQLLVDWLLALPPASA
jgi:alpha-beta hydrolase superfamily lysophospholipase